MKLPLTLGRLSPVVGAIALLSLAQTVSAQGPEPQRVEVTASKRTQVVLDVPYAVTAIGETEIRDRGVVDIKEMQSAVPSLYITQNAPGQSRIQLRGLSQGVGFGAALVGGYLDDISINMPDAQRSLDVPLIDMQRIEVLRGPQGTLYGDGSMGGVIRFITRNPRLDRQEFSVETGASTYSGGGQGWRANAVANLPLAKDTAALRIVVGHEDIPGWVDNSATGQKDYNSARRDFARGKVLVKISPQVDASLMLFHTDTRTKNNSSTNDGTTFPGFIPTPTLDRTSLGNLVVNADLGAVRLVSSTGYLDRKLDTAVDFTGAYRGGLPPPVQAIVLPRPNSGGAYRQDMSMRITTQELRLESDDKGPLTWTAGVSYRKTDTQSVTSDVWTDSALRLQGGYSGTAPTNVEQTAVFGELTFAFDPAWSLTGGMRSFRETAVLQATQLPSGLAPPGTPSRVFDLKDSYRKTTPRLNLLWRYSTTGAAYATVSQGFRSGGFNTPPGQPASYGPEDITTFELGNKGSLFDSALQYEVAVYQSRYRNIQSQDLAPGCTPATCRTSTINSGSASGPGLDVAVSWQVAKGLAVAASVGYSDLTYTVTTRERNEGDPLNFIPKLTGSLSVTQRFNWAAGLPGMWRVDYQHADAARFIIRNQGANAQADATNYLNARVGLELSSWQLYLDGKNLNNFRGVLQPALFGIPATRSAPRSLGVTLRTQF
jgi:iron complex outermembrane recepter protein